MLYGSNLTALQPYSYFGEIYDYDQRRQRARQKDR